MSRPLGELVRRAVEEAGLARPMRSAEVILRWPGIVGPLAASHARAVAVTAGVLLVEVDSGLWTTELALLTPTLLERIAEEVGEGVVREIRFVGPRRGRPAAGAPGTPGPGDPDAARRGPGSPGPYPPWPDRNDLLSVGLTEDERRLVTGASTAAKDPELGAAVARWVALTLKARRWLAREHPAR